MNGAFLRITSRKRKTSTAPLSDVSLNFDPIADTAFCRVVDFADPSAVVEPSVDHAVARPSDDRVADFGL